MRVLYWSQCMCMCASVCVCAYINVHFTAFVCLLGALSGDCITYIVCTEYITQIRIGCREIIWKMHFMHKHIGSPIKNIYLLILLYCSHFFDRIKSSLSTPTTEGERAYHEEELTERNGAERTDRTNKRRNLDCAPA